MKTIELTQGKATLVDDDVYEWAKNFNWFAAKGAGTFYAVKNTSRKLHKGGKQSRVYLHQEIMRPKAGFEIDHRDGDGLNNLRDNLRHITHQQNHWAFRTKHAGASSRYRGVCWHKAAKKWYASIRRSGKCSYLGVFETEEAAAVAYDIAARKTYGTVAQLNFKQEGAVSKLY